MSALDKFIESPAPLMPVVRVDRPQQIEHICAALQAGGLGALEITLRTAAAWQAIAIAKKKFPDMLIGAGTVSSAEQVQYLADLGVDFCVSPGVSEQVLMVAQNYGMAILPGTISPSDIMLCREYGVRTVKFFPAAVATPKMVEILGGPFPDVRFCTTGGLGPHNFADFLRLPQVVAVGGGWMLPDEALAQGDWKRVEELTRQAADAVRAVLAEKPPHSFAKPLETPDSPLD